MNISIKRYVLFLLFTLAVLFVASTLQVNSHDGDTEHHDGKPPEVSFDGLHLEPSKDVAVLYIKPDADFSVYKKFVMLKAYVAFKKNWQRQTKVAGRRISNKDVERIKVEVADLFHETFREELEEGGYPQVTEADDDVLILRPAVIDLVITAPDINVPMSYQSYVAQTGAATMYLELYDSVSGEILARIIDRRNTRYYSHGRVANSVTNRADMKDLFRRWADMLREGLDEVHQGKAADNKAS